MEFAPKHSPHRSIQIRWRVHLLGNPNTVRLDLDDIDPNAREDAALDIQFDLKNDRSVGIEKILFD